MQTFTRTCAGCRYVLPSRGSGCPRCMERAASRPTTHRVTPPRDSRISILVLVCGLGAFGAWGAVLLPAAIFLSAIAVYRREPAAGYSVAFVMVVLVLGVATRLAGV